MSGCTPFGAPWSAGSPDQARRGEGIEYLHYYSDEKSVYMKINYVNPDHVHVLVDLTANLSIEQMMHLLKGASSHRINERNLLARKFGWARGYGIFSVSHSLVGEVAKYIAEQEEHHQKVFGKMTCTRLPEHQFQTHHGSILLLNFPLL